MMMILCPRCLTRMVSLSLSLWIWIEWPRSMRNMEMISLRRTVFMDSGDEWLLSQSLGAEQELSRITWNVS